MSTPHPPVTYSVPRSAGPSARAALLKLLTAYADSAALGAWLEARAEEARAGVDAESAQERRQDLLQEQLLTLPRAVGRRHLVRPFAERGAAALEGVWGPLPVGDWRADEAARVWLISAVLGDGAGSYGRLFSLYDAGDTEAKVACVRALNFCEGDPAEGLTLIHDAGRTYLPTLMSAAWRHSPFSAQHLSAEEFRKAVLKSLFCDVPVDDFIGLERRADEELSRSLCEYANEREAAGRLVPNAVWTVAARFPLPGLVARLIGRLEHPAEPERLTAARALTAARDPRAESFLRERLAREKSGEVRAALTLALEALSPVSV
jgi:hypothetical protein